MGASNIWYASCRVDANQIVFALASLTDSTHNSTYSFMHNPWLAFSFWCQHGNYSLHGINNFTDLHFTFYYLQKMFATHIIYIHLKTHKQAQIWATPLYEKTSCAKFMMQVPSSRFYACDGYFDKIIRIWILQLKVIQCVKVGILANQIQKPTNHCQKSAYVIRNNHCLLASLWSQNDFFHRVS